MLKLNANAKALIKRIEQQKAQHDYEAANSTALTLEEALAEKGRTQHATQIKNWYAQGYYKKSNGYWYDNFGGREMRKYSTA